MSTCRLRPSTSGWAPRCDLSYTHHCLSASQVPPAWVVCNSRQNLKWPQAHWRSNHREVQHPFSFASLISALQKSFGFVDVKRYSMNFTTWKSLVPMHSSSTLVSNCCESWFVWWNMDPFTNNSRKVRSHKRHYLWRTACQLWDYTVLQSTLVSSGDNCCSLLITVSSPAEVRYFCYLS